MPNDITRRSFATFAAATAAGGLVLAANAAEETDGAPGLKSEFLFEMEADLEPPQPIGNVPDGGRQIFYAKGGWVKGPKITGEVLPGGGDWFRMRSDGVGELDVRATMKTNDGALIYVTYRGLVDGAYFRTTPYFETSAEKYAWMNKIVSVGVLKPTGAGKVGYHVYQIL